MAQQVDAGEFYDKVVLGTRSVEEKIDLEARGYKLKDVEIHPVEKSSLLDTLSTLPEDMVKVVEEVETEEEAEEKSKEWATKMDGDVVDQYEKLCRESLEHDDLADSQMNDLIDLFSLELLFEVGTLVVEVSSERDDEIKDFYEQGQDKN